MKRHTTYGTGAAVLRLPKVPARASYDASTHLVSTPT